MNEALSGNALKSSRDIFHGTLPAVKVLRLRPKLKQFGGLGKNSRDHLLGFLY